MFNLFHFGPDRRSKHHKERKICSGTHSIFVEVFHCCREKVYIQNKTKHLSSFIILNVHICLLDHITLLVMWNTKFKPGREEQRTNSNNGVL